MRNKGAIPRVGGPAGARIKKNKTHPKHGIAPKKKLPNLDQ